jgi:hypothetical protein
MKIIYRILSIALFLLWANTSLMSQTRTECGTRSMPIPNFDQNQYKAFEQDFLQKVRDGVAFDVLQVPIKAHIVRTSNGTGGMTVADLNTEITRVNAFYANANIQFYLCNGINYINDDNLFSFDDQSQAEENLLTANNVSNIINIYFTNMQTYCGYAYFPGGPNVIVMENSCAINGSTLAHEIGHFFGLYHTHDTSGGREFVNGANCSTAGDRLCDTPADPTLGGSNVNNTTNCQYTGTTLDPNGQAYTPDTRNVMSYSLKTCRTRFSAQQYARIAFIQQSQRAYLTCSTAVTCTAPTTPSVSAIATTTATVSWGAVSGATAYRVEYKTALAATWTALANTTSTSQLVTGLTSSTAYNVRVFTICAATTSTASPISNFSTNSLVSCTDANEPNNTTAQAKLITVNSITSGSITVGGDEDYFTFTSTAANPNITVELGNLGTNFDLYLYNSSGTLLTSSTRSSNNRELVTYNTALAGTYYIRVIGFSNATHSNCYRLTVITDASSQGCTTADTSPK